MDPPSFLLTRGNEIEIQDRSGGYEIPEKILIKKDPRLRSSFTITYLFTAPVRKKSLFFNTGLLSCLTGCFLFFLTFLLPFGASFLTEKRT